MNATIAVADMVDVIAGGQTPDNGYAEEICAGAAVQQANFAGEAHV